MKTIIDALTNKTYSIYSNKGKQILRKFISTIKGGMEEEDIEEINIANSDEEEENQFVNDLIRNRDRNMLRLPTTGHIERELLSFLLSMYRISNSSNNSEVFRQSISGSTNQGEPSFLMRHIRSWLYDNELIRNRPSFIREVFRIAHEQRNYNRPYLFLLPNYLEPDYADENRTSLVEDIGNIEEKIQRLIDFKNRIVSLFQNSNEFKKIFGSLDILDNEVLKLRGKNVKNHMDILNNVVRKYESYRLLNKQDMNELKQLLGNVKLIVINELTPFLSKLMNEIYIFEPPQPPSLLSLKRQNAYIGRNNIILDLLILYSIYASNASNYIDQIIQRLRKS